MILSLPQGFEVCTDVAEIQQYQRNLKDARSWLEITESALSDMGDIFQRVRNSS